MAQPRMGRRLIARRTMIRLLAVTLLASSAALPAHAVEYHQAPMLDGQAGLPPVAQRLPQTPEVVAVKEVGRYGGTLRTVARGDADHNAILRIIGNMGLTRWSPDFQKPVPNLAASWEVSADGTTYTFRLRPGTRWSDGQPFTSDDVLFFVNDLLPDKQFFTSPPSQYVVNGQPMRAEKIDDNSFRLIFAGPYLRLPEVLAGPLGQHPVLYAKHYCAQFTPKYNPNVQQLVAQAHVGDWSTLLRQRCGDIEIPARWANLDRPVLDPWVVTEPYTGSTTEVMFRRNPYFWQVDTAGNQLPYIDKVQFRVISDLQSIMLATIGGQLDLMVRHINTINNKPVLAQHAAEGKYTLVALEPADVASAALWLNQTDKDPKLRALLTNRDFRVALSLGMDREEINDVVFLGQAAPWQTSPLPEDRFYNEQLATQYIKHDPAQANTMLDKIGLSKRDSDGIRLFPDGGRVALTADVEVANSTFIDVLQLVKQQWATIGVELRINTMERSLFYDRAQNNAYDISIQALPGGLHPTSDPRAWLSVHTLDSRQSLLWVRWYASGGTQGEAPSASMQQRLKLWDEFKTTADPAKADALVRQILQLSADAFDVIGVERGLTTFGIRATNLHNVPAQMPFSWEYPTPAPTLPQQYFFAQ